MSPEEIFEAKTALENVQCDLSTNTEICHLGEPTLEIGSGYLQLVLWELTAKGSCTSLVTVGPTKV